MLVVNAVFTQTNYFIDVDFGADGNAGTSITTAWQNISKVNSSSFSAGDTISFRTDDTWREQLTVPSSGSAGSPIVFTKYDSTGESGVQPLINGADIFTGFEQSLGGEGCDATWTSSSDPYETFTTSGCDITSAINTAGFGIAFGTPTLTNGTTYRLVFDFTLNSGTGADIRTGANTALTGGVTLESNLTTGSRSYDFDGGGAFSLGFRNESGEAANFSVANFSLKELADSVYTKSSITTESKLVIYDDTLLTGNDGQTTAVGLNEWDWNSNILYVNVGEDPDTRTLEAGQRQEGIQGAALDFITVDDLKFKYQNRSGIRIEGGGTNWLIQNCLMTEMGDYENEDEGDGILCFGTDNTFQNNTMHDMAHNGVNFVSPAANNVVQNNTIFDTHHNLIDIKPSGSDIDSITIRYNDLSCSTGFAFTSHAVFFNGTGADATKVKIYYNLIYNMTGSSINIVDSVLGLEVYGNVFYITQDANTRFIESFGDAAVTFTAKNNIGLDPNEVIMYRRKLPIWIPS